MPKLHTNLTVFRAMWLPRKAKERFVAPAVFESIAYTDGQFILAPRTPALVAYRHPRTLNVTLTSHHAG